MDINTCTYTIHYTTPSDDRLPFSQRERSNTNQTRSQAREHDSVTENSRQELQAGQSLSVDRPNRIPYPLHKAQSSLGVAYLLLFNSVEYQPLSATHHSLPVSLFLGAAWFAT